MLIDSADVFLGWEDVESVLGQPGLGFMPLVEEESLRLICDISSFSPLMESCRTLRTNLRFAAEQPIRSLAVTSSVPAEGKSTTAANLAMAMAMSMDRNRIILVDADLRRPAQHKLFKVDSSPGLVDILLGTHKLEEVLRPTMVPNVSLIPAGTSSSKAPELLDSDAMRQTLAELEALCDTVLLDTPPVLAVCDASIVSALVGGVLMVIGHGETKRVHVQQSLKILDRVGATYLGTVINRMPRGLSYYYGKYYAPTTSTPSESKVEIIEAPVVVRRSKQRTERQPKKPS